MSRMMSLAFCNIAIELVGICMLLPILLTYRGQLKHSSSSWIYRLMLLCCLLMLLSDAASWLTAAVVPNGGYWQQVVLNLIYYLSLTAFSPLWLLYAYQWFFDSPASGWVRRAILWVFAFGEALVLANLFTGWIYCIAPDDLYLRGPWFGVYLALHYLYVLGGTGAMIAAVMRRPAVDKVRYFIVFSIFPSLGVMALLTAYDLSSVAISYALALQIIYVTIQQRVNTDQQLQQVRFRAQTAQLEQELTQSRVAIMLSQIQPHFLYNALNTIQYLCMTQPETAAKIVEKFSLYLRGNMDSLTQRDPIPFSTDLAHLENYLAIERLRFPDVRIEYDLKTQDFYVPPLTVQPLVENAIRYGVTRREHGGTVCVSTWEEADAYCLQVRDNGVGFDPRQVQYDGRSHLGISNTANRLQNMCGGSLKIDSNLGEGTAVTITLPKKKPEVRNP